MSQKVDAQSAPKFRDFLTPIVSADRYTVFRTNDNSHGAAKRYSFEVVVNGTASKAEIAAIVRQLTSAGAKRRYHRNHLVEGRWGDSDAQVVWTFIYPSAEDHSRRNHICHSLWIRGDLAEEFRPLGFDGENVGDNVIVDWSENYDARAQHTAVNTFKKEAYLSKVLPLIEELKELLAAVEEQLLAVSRGELTEAGFISTSERSRERIHEIHFEISDMSFAPFECRDMDLKLDSFVAYLDNISLHYSKKGLGAWNAASRLEQSLQQRSYARKALQHLEYEILKVR